MRSPCLLCGEKDRSYSEKVRRWAVSWARGRGDLRVAAHRCSPELMERRGGFMDTAESTGPGGGWAPRFLVWEVGARGGAIHRVGTSRKRCGQVREEKPCTGSVCLCPDQALPLRPVSFPTTRPGPGAHVTPRRLMEPEPCQPACFSFPSSFSFTLSCFMLPWCDAHSTALPV